MERWDTFSNVLVNLAQHVLVSVASKLIAGHSAGHEILLVEMSHGTVLIKLQIRSNLPVDLFQRYIYLL